MASDESVVDIVDDPPVATAVPVVRPATLSRRRRRAPTYLFWVVFPLAIAVAVLAPIAVASLAHYLYDRTRGDRIYPLMAAAPPADSYTRLHIEILALDELGRQVTLRVSGNHICDKCGFQTRVVFFALRLDSVGREGLPPQAAINLPAASEQVTSDLQLPIGGDVIDYPFDRYVLRLGVALEHLTANGNADGPPQTVALTRAQGVGRLFMTLEEQVPQVDIVLLTPVIQGGLDAVPAARGQPDYLTVNDIVLDRPAYLKIQVVLLIALVAAGAVYAAWLQPLRDVMTRVSTLVLGIWGIRSLMLSPLPPFATAVDAVLTLVILTVLSALTMRALYGLHDRAGLSLLPGSRSTKTEPLMGDVDRPAPPPADLDG